MKIEEYIAHKTEDGKTQTIDEHLKATARLAKGMAIEEFCNIAEYAGLIHDVGKFRTAFQRRVNGEDIRCEHAAAAAQESIQKMGKTPLSYLLAYCTAGHHTGLQNGGTAVDDPDEASLSGALKRDMKDYEEARAFFDFEPPECTAFLKSLTQNCVTGDNDEIIERFAFFTRYIYSCLTDADFIDTESFFNPGTERGISGDFKKALDIVDQKLSGFKAKTSLQKARKDLQEQAYRNSGDAQISLLNMPTGSGKTLCSIKLALERAVKRGKKHIIYVIPYTSIIEQTADIFEDMFKEVLPVVEHHSNYNADDNNEDETTADKIKRACENWDAPLIVTTNVQLFESLYHNKSSRLRKLHNLADSILVFDEIHMMPVEYLQPCLRAIGYVTSYLHSEAVFLSATMPDFKDLFCRYIKMGTQNELITDKSLFRYFEKCIYHYIGTCSDEKLLNLAENYNSSLIIVNSRSEARRIYNLCSGRKFHLSTYMMPVHRSAVIEEIRKCIGKEKITVISTSLIEAGVDLDFEAVFRELSGLDSIIQAAGRCNREGLRENGDVYVFENPNKPLKNELEIKANISRAMFQEFENISEPECINEYYSRLYRFNDDRIKQNSIANGVSSVDAIPFRSYTDLFALINTDTVSVVIPCGENTALLEALKYSNMPVRRRLQKYCVSVYFYEFEDMLKRGIISDNGTGVFVLGDLRGYKSETGLDPKYEENNIV